MVKVQPLDVQIDPKKCMGDWYVQVASPTPLDKNQRNGLEQYTWDEKKQQVCEHAQTHLVVVSLSFRMRCKRCLLHNSKQHTKMAC